MENKSKKLTIGLIVLIIIVALVGVFVIGSNESAAEAEAAVENVTDMDALKQSEYTNEAFGTVELGDSKSTIEEKMGELTPVEAESEYDIFSVQDDDTLYYFYFENDTLANVSVFLQ